MSVKNTTNLYQPIWLQLAKKGFNDFEVIFNYFRESASTYFIKRKNGCEFFLAAESNLVELMSPDLDALDGYEIVMTCLIKKPYITIDTWYKRLADFNFASREEIERERIASLILIKTQLMFQ